jgi:hypothetical protein
MSTLEQLQARILDARQERDEAEERFHKTNRQLQEVTGQLSTLQRFGVPDGRERIAELTAQQQRLSDTLAGEAKELKSLQDSAHVLLRDLFDLSPRRLVEQLSDSLPFLLLPVRIETKFVNRDNLHELWVRIFPDVISNFTHEAELTVDEIEAGEGYWTKRWEARTETPEEQETTHRGLWNVLATSFGSERAAWVIRRTKPLNWQDDLSSIEQLEFSVQEEKNQQPWTRAPYAQAMPDRFVVTTYFGGTLAHEVAGAHIPDKLKLGPDPLAIEEQLKRKDDGSGEIEVDEQLAWMFDFEKAESVGMAVRIPLEPKHLRGFNRVVVLGVRLSSNAEQSRQLVEALVDNHHYANEGLSLVPQGTPTNNTEESGSGFTTLDTAQEKSFEIETGRALFTEATNHFDKSDGQRLAEALGISPAFFYHIGHSNGVDIKEALAMNSVLWAGTWGLYLRRWMEPLFSERSVELTQEFFTEFVTGRGLLPAIRVGNQPYGVLVTSAFDKWRWSEQEIRGRDTYYNNLKTILDGLEARWQNFADNSVAHAGRNDSFQNLLSVVGLQASAVEYYSRKGVSDLYTWNYLSFGGFSPSSGAFWNELQLRKNRMLADIGLGAQPNLFIRNLTFLSNLESLHWSPVIDQDPKLPLSETDGIQRFNSTDNYIDWLLKSDWESIKSEVFKDEQGKSIPPPKALLYKLLHRAYTEHVNESILRLLLRLQVISAWPKTRELENVGGQQHLIPLDFQNVDASRISAGDDGSPLTTEKITLAAHLQNSLVANFAPVDEAIPLLSIRSALETLRLTPTARLERLFAEHMDLCSYRLDAWQTGIFTRRLHHLRQSDARENPSGVRSGIYIGAFGWVEDLRPARSKQNVSLDTLPQELRKAEKGPILEDVSNEGYIHGPSMTHAVTAAVLRNAYRSHHGEETMAVNLSSERVRTAMSYLEGLRNNQELAALLGYQFERGLHDNYPIELKLDAVVYQFRDRFPLISKVLTPVPDGTPAEVVEARNVVNGYDLLTTVRQNGNRFPYNMLNPVPSVEQQRALDAEIDGLANALDALGDLSLAESVFQVMQGNYDRAGGMVQALTDAKTPPEPEIVNTPRSGQGITLRVAINFDVAQTTGWSPSIPMTPRAFASAQLNHWLSERLPEPQDIQVAVKQQSLAQEFISFDALGLQPIDLVLMSGNQVGDNSSELERFLVYHFRETKGLTNDIVSYFYQKPDPSIPDEQALVFNPREVEDSTKTSLYELLPLLRALRKIVTECRPLHAQDFMLSTEAQQFSKGYNEASANLSDLFNQVKATRDTLSLASNNLSLLVNGALLPAYKSLEDDPDHVIDAAWQARLDTTRDLLLRVHAFGFAESLPASATGLTLTEIEALVTQAEAVSKMLGKRLTEADELLKPLTLPAIPADATSEERKRIEDERNRKLDEALSNYTQTARLLLGTSFNLVPLYKFHPNNAAELIEVIAGADALFDSAEDKAVVVEQWLQGIAVVRPQMASLESVAIFNDMLRDNTFDLSPIQLPHATTGKWIGVRLDEQEKREERISIVMHQLPDDLMSIQCGLLVDEWTEVIPTTKETTGVAFHYNRPNAMPPQTILLAVTPELKGAWSWDNLMDILNDTLSRAKRRAVEPEMIDGSISPQTTGTESSYFQVLPAVLHDFTTYNLVSLFVRDAFTRSS